MGRARDISKVFSTGTALATDTEISAFNYLTQSSASTVYQTKAATGLTLITPTSITATGGSGSISATGTVSFTSASAISLNGCFTSTYDNYKIVYSELVCSSGTTVRGRLGSSGTPTSAGYYYGAWLVTHGASTSTGSGSNQSSIFLNEIATSINGIGITIDVFSPNKNIVTTFNYQGFCTQQLRMHVGSGQLSQSVITDFQIFPDTGTLTGIVSVYGYNK